MIKVSVLGYGTVGSGVVEVLTTNKDSIAKKVGQEIEVKHILDLRDFPGDPHEAKVVHDFNQIVNDDEVQIVVETMGGVKPAYDFVKASLEAGKSVCTSNKELVAKHGAELIAIAKAKNINFFFEASVGGGIPIIRPINECVTGDVIEEISGILNGTTNYILSKMASEGAQYADVLKQAQDLGYAERNPEADVEGYDACRKIAILTSLAYGKQVDFEDIYTEGITKISATDIKYAKALGASIKIFGSSKKVGDKIYAKVAPVMIDANHPLYMVNDVFNGIFVKGNMVGDLMFYGSGAGKLPTASAVVGDVVAAAKNLNVNVPIIWDSEKLELADIKEASQRFFVRLSGDKAANEAKVSAAFGNVDVVDAGIDGEYAFITSAVTEGDFAKKAEELGNVVSRIRVDF
ncbi:MAG: homoserine dehydrogenase [Lachnospiraceae bacterium]|jgi:homoserine dehydrogenase|nr:homoserine dehydrogenase [Lachnospiraceae bacterium]MBQ5559962.1 homoserine dehydrogenase [Lachnospiraceae bacterium]MCR4802801.1 homoserine dehydrogenase [Lachnospiraceae bacterium]